MNPQAIGAANFNRLNNLQVMMDSNNDDRKEAAEAIEEEMLEEEDDDELLLRRDEFYRNRRYLDEIDATFHGARHRARPVFPPKASPSPLNRRHSGGDEDDDGSADEKGIIIDAFDLSAESPTMISGSSKQQQQQKGMDAAIDRLDGDDGRIYIDSQLFSEHDHPIQAGRDGPEGTEAPGAQDEHPATRRYDSGAGSRVVPYTLKHT
jgi:hypothetical protein